MSKKHDWVKVEFEDDKQHGYVWQCKRCKRIYTRKVKEDCSAK